MLLARLSLRRAPAPLRARACALPAYWTRAATGVSTHRHSRRADDDDDDVITAPVATGSAAAGFVALGFHAALVDALYEMGLSAPTAIQRKSAAAILARKDVLCTAQTGTGKTLAYLAPLVEQLHRDETAARAAAAAAAASTASADPTTARRAMIARPRALVVVPSRELALQVGDVAKKLAHWAKFASCTITAGDRKSVQQKLLARPLDVVIGTPGRLAKCIEKGDLFVSCVTTVVLDEADTLLDAKMGFRKELDAVLKPVQNSAAKRNAPLQAVLVAATLRAPLDEVVKKKFGALRLVSDDKLHQTPALLREEFVKVAPENKHSALRDALRLRAAARRHRRHGDQGDHGQGKTIVFCRTAASCNAADHMLREHGFASRCLHGEMPTPLREASVEAFRAGAVSILVCTDLAARGLHIDGVDHVVMCDFPASSVDYVHRAGRAGRAGEPGVVTSLVTRHDAALAHAIEQSKTNRKAIKDLRSDLTRVVGTVKEDEGDGRGRDESTTSPAGDKPKRKKKTTTKKATTSRRERTITGHGTKRLAKHKLRTL